jgi:hypothetical protein
MTSCYTAGGTLLLRGCLELGRALAGELDLRKTEFRSSVAGLRGNQAMSSQLRAIKRGAACKGTFHATDASSQHSNQGGEVATNLDGVHVLADAAHVRVDAHAASVHLLGVHTVSGVQVLHRAIGVHPVEAGIGLELGAQLGGQSQALLLLGELDQVGTLPHDGSTTSGHLEDLLLLGVPGDHIELLNLHDASRS